MKLLHKKKIITITIITAAIFAGVYFTLGGFGRSGPDAAPNLGEYGLVGYWNMEEGKGQTVYDRSGNGNNGTLGASTAVAKDDPVFTGGYSSAGAGGTALKFDGKDDYVNAGNAASLDITDAITIEAWVKPGSVFSETYYIASNSTGYGNVGYGFYKYKYNGGALGFVAGNGSAVDSLYSSGLTWLTSEWYHVVVSYNNLVATFYRNGVNVGSDTMNWTGSIATTTDHLNIGATTIELLPFNGSIDEVRIYNRALSADEIRQHYNQKKPVLEMKMDEGSGTSAKDDSFNSNDAAFPVADANKPTWSNP